MPPLLSFLKRLTVALQKVFRKWRPERSIRYISCSTELCNTTCTMPGRLPYSGNWRRRSHRENELQRPGFSVLTHPTPFRTGTPLYAETAVATPRRARNRHHDSLTQTLSKLFFVPLRLGETQPFTAGTK